MILQLLTVFLQSQHKYALQVLSFMQSQHRGTFSKTAISIGNYSSLITVNDTFVLSTVDFALVFTRTIK